MRLFVSHTHTKLAQTCVIQIYTERHLMLIMCVLDFLQIRGLGMITVCSLLLDFQRDNIVCSQLCDVICS